MGLGTEDVSQFQTIKNRFRQVQPFLQVHRGVFGPQGPCDRSLEEWLDLGYGQYPGKKPYLTG